MDSNTDPAALAECVAPLDDEDREAVRRYWDRVIEEVWSGVPVEAVPSSVVSAGLDERRRRRVARRGMARVAAAGRVAVRVVPAPVVAVVPVSGVAA